MLSSCDCGVHSGRPATGQLKANPRCRRQCAAPPPPPPPTRADMSSEVNYAPLPCTGTAAPPQPFHKACDVVRGSSLRGQSLSEGLMPGSEVPDSRVTGGKVPFWLEADSAEDVSGMGRVLRKLQIRSPVLRECMAECFGVYIMILLGCGSVAQVTTSQESKGQYLSINLGFALGTTFGVFVSRGVSGAHLNPAVSLSLCVLGRHPWVKLPFYIFSQVLGAFLAAATVGLQYYDAIHSYSGGKLTVRGPTATAGIFSTYPADYLSLWGGIVDQVIGTAVLLVCVLALEDQKNSPSPPGLEPVLVGAVVLVIGVSMGSNCGYALNPARDFGPRLFTYIAGWGADVFRAGGGWWWVPLVAPCMGALLGTFIYEVLIELHHPQPLFELQSLGLEATEDKKELELDPVDPDFKKPEV